MRKKFFPFLLIFLFLFFLFQIKKVNIYRTNIILLSKPLTVISLEPKRNLIFLRLPDNLYLEVPPDLGKYRLSSVYRLGGLEGRGEELLKAALEDYLAVPIDGWVKAPDFSLFLTKRETNFSKLNLIKIWWSMKRLRIDKIKSIDLDQTNVLKKEVLADGSEVWDTEFFRLDSLVKKYFSDSRMEKEGIKVEIRNGTKHLGLANKLARLITNLGGSVVAIGNSSIKHQASSIKYKKKSLGKSYTLRKLEKILAVKAELEMTEESRADLLIVVGEDYFKR